MSSATAVQNFDSASAMPDAARGALRDLLLALADNKRLLGLRYSDWMLGSPTLETGIAASSMAQDEWGHARLTYAMLSDFGEDPGALEHSRDAAAYHSMELLDSPFASWTEMVAASLIIDTALAVQYESLVDSRYTPGQNRVQKLIDEEMLHFQYGAGWVQRLAGSQLRADFLAAIARQLPAALRWFGPADSAAVRALVDAGVVSEDADTLRDRYLSRIGPILQQAGFAGELHLLEEGGSWVYSGPVAFDEWDDRRRRGAPGGPDETTLARARGDKNRALLLD